MIPDEEDYDAESKTKRRRFSLLRGLIYLSEWSNEQGVIRHYSLDVEKADDSHYVISTDEMGKLAGYLGCLNLTAELVKALSAFFRKKWGAKFCCSA